MIPRGSQNYTYDPKFSQLVSYSDDLGKLTLFDIDPDNGNVRSKTQVVGDLGGADDLTTRFTYLPSGLVDTLTDPLGRITDYDYDNKGRITRITQAKGTADESVSLLEYDIAGNVVARTDAKGHRKQYRYDAMGRITKEIEADPDGAGPLTSPTTTFSYDLAGNLIDVIDPLGHHLRAEYNARNEIVVVTDANNNRTLLDYDQQGNLIRETDPLGNTKEFRYDARNRRVQVIDADGGVARITYDEDDNVTSLTDALGNRTAYVFDGRDRTTSIVDPLGKATRFTYDANDNLISTVDRLGRTTNYTYNDIGQLLTETWLAADDSVVNSIAFSYDDVQNLVAISDANATVDLAYDDLDRLTSISSSGQNGLPESTLAYTYDSVGNLLQTIDTINGTEGGTIVYQYDALDRMIAIMQSGVGTAPKRADLQYNANGQLTSLARFSNLAGTAEVATTSFGYDALSRVSSITHRNKASTVLDSFNYQYDAAGRITRITDIDGVTNFSFDTRDQLTSATHSDVANPDESYSYDTAGNRTSSHLPGSDYVFGDEVADTPDNNQLTSDGVYEYEYDALGNLSRRMRIADGTTREFTWDHRNRLIRVTDRDAGGGPVALVVEYTYDALNRRLAKQVDETPADAVDGVITYFIYDGDHVLAELVDPDGSGPMPTAESMRYLYGQNVDQILAQEDSVGSVLWYLSDNIGTTHDLVNSSGKVVNHLKYDSYGNLVSQSNAIASTNYRFTGREFDAETGLMYYRARYYDASIGRFISEDPIGFLGSDANLYRYVGNLPTQRIDPFGTNYVDDAISTFQAFWNRVYQDAAIAEGGEGALVKGQIRNDNAQGQGNAATVQSGRKYSEQSGYNPYKRMDDEDRAGKLMEAIDCRSRRIKNIDRELRERRANLRDINRNSKERFIDRKAPILLAQRKALFNEKRALIRALHKIPVYPKKAPGQLF